MNVVCPSFRCFYGASRRPPQNAIRRLVGEQPVIPVLANTITADMGLIPGLAFIGPAMGLPLSVMASFIERPFYSRAGVGTHAIWYSLQANLISLIVGFVALVVCGLLGSAVFTTVWAGDMALFLIWPFVAVAISIAVERGYIAARLRTSRVGWGWSAAGNIVSAAACVGLLFFIVTLRGSCPSLVALLRPFAWPLTLFSLAGSCVLFAVAFIATRRSRLDRCPAAATQSAASMRPPLV